MKTMTKPIKSPFSKEYEKRAKLNSMVSPENRMSYQTMDDFAKAIEEGTPIMEMEPGRIMPIFMFISDVQMSFPPLGSTDMNYMICISHIKKTNRLEVKGRMRFEATSRKTVFGLKHDFALTDLEKAKTEIRDMYETMKEGMNLQQSHEPWELNFDINEDIDSVIKKLNDSNHFNIGVVDKPK